MSGDTGLSEKKAIEAKESCGGITTDLAKKWRGFYDASSGTFEKTAENIIGL